MKKVEERYRFVDGLRGIAALGVVLHHLIHSTVLEVSLRRILPEAVLWISRYGALGVQIFFVISGFVIAHSLRQTAMTMPAVVNFIARRQLRLDPPYWITLLFVIVLGAIESRIPGLVKKPSPDVLTAVVNAFYLQNITGARSILAVAWTLCLEVQFYLVLIFVLMLGSRLDRQNRNGVSVVSLWCVIFIGLVSMSLSELQGAFADSFLPYWSYFSAGVLCKWCLERKVNWMIFGGFVFAFAVTAWWQNKPPMYMGLVTVIALYTAGATGHLSDWLNQRWIQYLGKTSYSLYLIHLPIILLIMRGGYKLTQENAWAALGWFGLALSTSIAAAHFLHVVIERPSVRLASRLKGRPAAADNSVEGLLEVMDCAPRMSRREEAFQ